VRKFAKAVVGLLLIFVVHLPRLAYLGLLWSFAAVFNNRPTLTADPAEHLKRARKILRRGRLSELLYAALELRFALERMTQLDLIFADLATNRMLDDPSPVRKLASLHQIAPEATAAHDFLLVDKTTGERHKMGEYKPLDKARVSQIQGRLGDLLHPKEGLMLGVPDDPWYVETRRFLNETLEYLGKVHRDRSPFFTWDGVDAIEMVRTESGLDASALDI
jgi:hypothetical protein